MNTATIKTSTTTTETAPAKKQTKQDRVRSMRKKFPEMSNKAIAEEVGCNATYVSQVLRGTTSTATKKRRRRRTSTQIVTASKAATSTTPTTDTAAILKARRDMACIISRVGGCTAKTLLEDVIVDAT